MSSDSFNVVASYPRVTLCPITGAENVPRRYDTDVFLRKRETGLTKNSVVRCVEIYTVFRHLLIAKVSTLPGKTMKKVEAAMALYLALPNV